MLTTLEVDLEVAARIRALARERGVPVFVYLRDLIEHKTPKCETGEELSSEGESASVAPMGGEPQSQYTHPFESRN